MQWCNLSGLWSSIGNDMSCALHLSYCSWSLETSRNSTSPAGFSQTSVFLNLHFLVAASKKQLSDHGNLKAFPWILWSLWKERNALVFERNRITPHSTIAKALEETEIWYQLLCNDHPPHTTTASPNAPHGAWKKPPADVVKCNVGMAWEASDYISGSSWIVRDCQGKALHHSRQALLGSSSKMESDLRSLLWAVQAMGDLRHKKVFFEASSVEVRESLLNPYRCPSLSSLILRILKILYCFEKWTICHVSDQKNKVAKTIAESVISGSRVQSYVASGSPRWLAPSNDSTRRQKCLTPFYLKGYCLRPFIT